MKRISCNYKKRTIIISLAALTVFSKIIWEKYHTLLLLESHSIQHSPVTHHLFSWTDPFYLIWTPFKTLAWPSTVSYTSTVHTVISSTLFLACSICSVLSIRRILYKSLEYCFVIWSPSQLWLSCSREDTTQFHSVKQNRSGSLLLPLRKKRFFFILLSMWNLY